MSELTTLNNPRAELDAVCDRLKIDRDHNGRPKVPDPITGKRRTWTRATTLAGTIEDRHNIELWKQRMVARGIAVGGDRMLAQALAAGDDKDDLNKVVDSAMSLAQSNAAADTGTALHRILERIERGEELEVPAAFKPDVDAYFGTLKEHRIEVVPDWFERFVVVLKVDAAGTPDRLVQVDGFMLPMIGDLKTGAKQVDYPVPIAAQLAIYSRASHWYDGKEHHPMPQVDQDYALVAHMPAGQGKCDLYLIDLQRGWKIVELCAAARLVRKSKNLARPLVAPAPSEENNDNSPVDTSDDELRARIREIVGALEGAPLPVPWPAGVTPPKQLVDGWTPRERVQIVKWCDKCAPRTVAAPF